MPASTKPFVFENSWVVAETAAADLGDQRRNQRLAKVLDRLASRPTVSIPAACRGWAETQAAYRFFDNDAVTEQSVLTPHRHASIQRIAQERVVLLLQDTSEGDWTSKQDKIAGLGPLNDEGRQGLFMHPTVAVTPERLCLGVLSADLRVRQGLGQRDQRKQKAFADKESVHWLTGYQLACAVAEQVPDTQVVSVADREGDIYEIFAEAVPEEGRRKAAFIVRAQHDRAVTVDEQTGKLWQQAQQSPVLGQLTIAVPGSAKRQARTAKFTVQSIAIEPRVPYRREGKLPQARFYAVLIVEVDPPSGEEAITWLLLTDLPASTLAEASRVVAYYACRSMIEVFFRVLKTGCRVEARQLARTDRLRPCIALLMMVAWRILYVTWMGRAYPQLSCEAVFSADEWQSVWTVLESKPLPQEPPTLSDFIAQVARLGGHLGRKFDGEPGAQTIWIGMQRMHDFARAWQAFGPGRQNNCV
jgi:hypothetical protein